jgi:hypothetical protein
MKMLRGAAAFLLMVATVVLVECGKEETQTAQGQQAQPPPRSAAAKGGALTITCPDATTDATICADSAGDCVVILNVVTKTTDNTMTATPAKAWITDTSKIIWRAVEDNDSKKIVKLDRVHFQLTDTDPTDWKKGDKVIAEAKCPSGQKECEKKVAAKELTPCQPYAYTAILKHGGKTKRVDPEIEVGSVTPLPPPLQPTSTSGSTGTH